jgi:peroxiredoxin
MKSRNLLILVLSIIITACQTKTDRFVIKGHIAEADGKMLYLDRMGIDRIETVDSIKLDAEGTFSFSKEAGDCFDFYRLRVSNQSLVLVVDSTETINVIASLPVMQVAYQVEGSEDCADLRDLIMLQIGLQKDINRMLKYEGPEIGVLQQNINETIDIFKTEVKNRFILSHTDNPCAYYALFLSVNGRMIFNPHYDRQDAKCYAAVATTMDIKYPNAIRTVHLKNLALKCMKATASAVPASDDVVNKLQSVISESGIIEIELPDINAKIHKLSDLEGKVVLLDFTAYKTDYSAKYNLFLRDLYNKYYDKGFRIYQVSLDNDAHFWITAAKSLPWICVHDEASRQSTYAASYRVGALPTAFLINRNNEITERLEKTDGLEDKVIKLLSE